MNDNNSTSTGTLLLTFAGGALLGAGLALLFAPQSGRKTRRQITGMADDAQELAQEAVQDFKRAQKRGEQWIEKAKDYVDDTRSQVTAAMDRVRH